MAQAPLRKPFDDGARLLPGEPALLTVREVAFHLRTTDKAIWAQVERGLLADAGVLRLGRRVLFDRATFVAWLDRLRGQ